MPNKAADRERLINVSLNEDVVAKARMHSTNLTATIEALLIAFVAEQELLRGSKQQIAEQCADAWHAAYASMGTFPRKGNSL